MGADDPKQGNRIVHRSEIQQGLESSLWFPECTASLLGVDYKMYSLNTECLRKWHKVFSFNIPPFFSWNEKCRKNKLPPRSPWTDPSRQGVGRSWLEPLPLVYHCWHGPKANVSVHSQGMTPILSVSISCHFFSQKQSFPQLLILQSNRNS